MPAAEVMADALIKMSEEQADIPLDQFWTLLERFRADLVNQAFVMLGNQEDAEDVVQETLSQAFVNLHQLRELSKLGAWLRSINRHGALRLLRQRSHEQRLATAQAEALVAPQPTTLSTTAVKAKDNILHAVDSLPEQYREVLVLRYWEKLSNAQIAKRLGIPMGTIGSRMARANDLLAKKMKAILREEPPK